MVTLQSVQGHTGLRHPFQFFDIHQSARMSKKLLQDVFHWYTVKYKNFESARKFPGDFANFQ